MKHTQICVSRPLINLPIKGIGQNKVIEFVWKWLGHFGKDVQKKILTPKSGFMIL
jgi:hypothetical protein